MPLMSYNASFIFIEAFILKKLIQKYTNAITIVYMSMTIVGINVK